MSVNPRHATMADAMYAAERQARKETEERNQIAQAIAVAQALKKEQKIKQAATLARAEKDGLMASTFSKLNSEIRKDGVKSNNLSDRRVDDDLESENDPKNLASIGKKNTRAERDEQAELEEAKRERDEIRRMLRKENERNRRREQAGLGKSKNERDQDRDISEKIALG